MRCRALDIRRGWSRRDMLIVCGGLWVGRAVSTCSLIVVVNGECRRWTKDEEVVEGSDIGC